MEKSEGIPLILLIVTVIMLGIVVLIIYLVFAHKKKYLIQQNEYKIETIKAVINAQEEERNKIARNLHDSIGAELSMVQFNLSKYLHQLEPTTFDTTYLSQDIAILNSTVENIRTVCHDLFPLTLKQYGLLAKLKQTAENVQNSGVISCTYSESVVESDLNLTMAEKINLYRIFQELINNLLKHSKAKHITILSRLVDSSFQIIFHHDGIVFDGLQAQRISESGKGLGLTSIAKRAELIGGSVTYSTNNDGPEIFIKIPFV